ncbi:hypothetical protein [Saccharibacillus brassicae]|uniref:hypothetical protein n=1 Tax=Saccharibacillus brassicae TaxID=2583377 RepID=UPI00123AC8AF
MIIIPARRLDFKGAHNRMQPSTSRMNLTLDDYLVLLNVAVQVGDKKWQKEITRKLERIMRFEAAKA